MEAEGSLRGRNRWNRGYRRFVGSVTGVGSVIVNGVTYDTTAAEVFVENKRMGSAMQR